ncbi:hypothetical protein QN277_019221 [Acacia crassicarpa]|uniref:Retrotransposon gag domain-containing protein n=1 Tax=Acacia crassicarpa TaxID=499986 RepID=A0AAE1JY71_9FABA|nr:hypothetical protein QN277_019221 [Acacia crassicarpa]
MVQTRAALAKTMEARVLAIEEQLRLLDKIDDMEQKMGKPDHLEEQMGKLNQLDQLQEQMRHLLQATERQNDDQQRQRRGHGWGNGQNHGEPQHRPTHFTKMEFPHFHGREVDSWISKCERFFHLDGTAEAEKVTMASMGLDEASFAWHVASERRWRCPMGWNEYVVLLRDTFGLPVDKPMGELSWLRQIGTLIEFNTKFDSLSAKLDLSEEYLIDIYITGLSEEISHTVLLFNPKTLGEARRLAKVQEMSINHKASKKVGDKYVKPVTGSLSMVLYGAATNVGQNKGFNQLSQPAGSQSRDKTVNTSSPSNTMPWNVTVAKSSKPKSWKNSWLLSPEDEAEHRAKNLCFYCHEQFSRNHSCPQRHRMRLQFMELVEESETSPIVEVAPDMEDEYAPLISLHAINGVNTNDSMRIQGNVGKKVIQVLIDNGSTHDFMDYDFAVKMGWKNTEPPLAAVQVAGGQKLQVFGVWHGFRWKMQGLDFVCDIRIIKLNTFDIVLGLTWLKTIKSALWDYEKLSMQFWYRGKLC